MAAVKAVACVGLKLCEPLIGFGLKAVLRIPDGVADSVSKWVKERFTDHSLELTKAVTTAHDRAWQAVALALATDTILSHVANFFRNGDLKAVQKQIRQFIATADTGLEGASDGLRTKACDELLKLKKAGRLGVDGVELNSLDLTRFASAAKVTEDAHGAITFIATELSAEAPHLARVLKLAPLDGIPPGGTPLLAAAFTYFLRREIATNPELAREVLYDGLRLLTLKQQAGFDNLERDIKGQWEALTNQLSDGFATLNAKVDSSNAKLDEVLRVLHVVTEARNPLKVTVENEEQKRIVEDIVKQIRVLPSELLSSDMLSRLGDILAAAGRFKEAACEQEAAGVAAREAADRQAEADAAYKLFKAECENRKWEPALAALTRAIALDEPTYRPVPKHYVIDSILGAGSFGVVLKCRDTAEHDDEGNPVVVAVKTFRATDLERPLNDIFAEASVLKRLSHENVIGIHERGFADGDAQQRPFLAMEFVDGVTLEEHLSKDGNLTVADFTAIFRQIAAALHAAHTGKRQIIHRDLKPANVMVWKDGEVWRVKVIDFGLAVRSAERVTSQQLPPGQRTLRDKSRAGTMDYAPPEQKGKQTGFEVGPHSDVFAFGKTALEALVGTTNPTDEDWEEAPHLSADLRRLLNRCVSETYLPDDPTKRRFHGFAPVLNVLQEIELEMDPAVKMARQKAEDEQRRKQDQERRKAEEEQKRAVEVKRQAEQKAREEEQRQAKEAEQRRQELEERDRLAAELAEAKRVQAELARKKAEAEAASAKLEEDRKRREAEERRRVEIRQVVPVAKPKTTLLVCPGCTGVVNVSHLSLGDLVRCPHCTSAFSYSTADGSRVVGERFLLPLSSTVAMEFAWCPPGAFTMGSPTWEEGRKPDEEQHLVRITKGFFCGVYPVTQAEWRAIMGDSPSYFKGLNLPVENVDWNDAKDFCKEVKKRKRIPVRLPTEAEWEYACRGGTTTPFYWGDRLWGKQANCKGDAPYGERPWFGEKYLKETCDVRSYEANFPHPWGLASMIGNVQEWCSDWYHSQYYAYSPDVDPECDDDEDGCCVARGGAWNFEAVHCRAARRFRHDPADRSNHLGFRVIFNPKQSRDTSALG